MRLRHTEVISSVAKDALYASFATEEIKSERRRREQAGMMEIGHTQNDSLILLDLQLGERVVRKEVLPKFPP